MEREGIKSPESGANRLLHWWHLGALLVLVLAVETGRFVIGGAPWSVALPALPHTLYAWCPILGGVAISIRRADRRSARSAVVLGLGIVFLMVVLDLIGGRAPPPPETQSAITQSGEGLAERRTGETGASWIRTSVAWAQGDLDGLDDRPSERQSYPTLHPRRRAADTLLDASLILQVFGVLGLVLAAGRWVRMRVTFQRVEDERAAHLVVAWLLSPMAVGLVTEASGGFHHGALFGTGSLLAILLPPLVILAAGVYAWIQVARHPPDDEGAEEPGP